MKPGILRRWILDATPPLIYAFLVILQRTIRWTEINGGTARHLWQSRERLIVAFWHGRMLLAPFFYRGRGLKILISNHADGELIHRVMLRFGFGSVRGSTRKGGTRAFREMVRSWRGGFDIVITPDGPRGPRYVVQPGIVELARCTQAPILPVSYSTRHRWMSPSWDGLLVPRPFTQGVFVWGHPLRVDPQASAHERERIRGLLEDRLRRLTEEADHYFWTDR